jgi:cytochrome c oxidase subunit 4
MATPSKTLHSLEHHILPLKTYFMVFGALLLLTYVTVQVSIWNLGEISIYVALGVAVIKASLVAGYFMHLKYDTRFHSVILAGSILFLVLFFGFTFIDLGSRDAINAEEGNFSYVSDLAGIEGTKADATRPNPEGMQPIPSAP